MQPNIAKGVGRSRWSSGSHVAVPAFGLSLIRNGNQVYKIPLDPGEVIMLRTFLTLALTKLFEVRLKKQQEYQKQQQNK